MAFRHNLKDRQNVQIDFSKSKSLTEQSHKDSCDIHQIMRKYESTGIINHVTQYQGTYADMADAPDYYTAQTIIADAKSMFETVPSRIRGEFENDPAKFLAFMQDPTKKAEIEAFGLDSSHLPTPEVPESTPQGDSHLQESLSLSKPKLSQNTIDKITEAVASNQGSEAQSES